MINYIKKVFQDMIDQLWTLLGMFIAWVVLDGSAKTIVGYAIICTLIAWAITYPIRNREEE
jgi:ABC-type multidrug transport system permease subunit